jgi:hypothetical protein
MKTLNKTERTKINDRLFGLPTYYQSVGLALGSILEVLESYGLYFEVLYVPKTGTSRIDLKSEDSEIENSLLSLQTYEMPSGRIEAVFYLS